MLDIPRIIKNKLFEQMLNDITTGNDGEFLPVSVILLNKLTNEEIKGLQFCDHYISNLNASFKLLPESSNIKNYEMPGNSVYVRGGIPLNKQLFVRYDSNSTVITSDTSELSIEWKPLDGTFHGYAIIGSKPLITEDPALAGKVFPVMAYEYYDSPVVMKNDDFQITWADTKLNDSLVKFLFKW